MKEQKAKRVKIVICLLVACILFPCGFFIGYVTDYYIAEDATAQNLVSTDTVQVTKIKQGYYFDGTGTDKAMIFYPGARVQHAAYSSLMKKLAEQGIDCFLVKMPLNLAIFGIHKADAIRKNYSYDKWYLAGHSLGGAMAASYAEDTKQPLEGIVLLGAYPAKDLSKKDFGLLSIYGSNDKVLNRTKYETNRKYWPAESKEVYIDGGNHAYFGNYHEQKGDGVAYIPQEEQQTQTAAAILEWAGIK